MNNDTYISKCSMFDVQRSTLNIHVFSYVVYRRKQIHKWPPFDKNAENKWSEEKQERKKQIFLCEAYTHSPSTGI